MSYSCNMRDCKFLINIEHFGDVLRCLIDDVEKHTVNGRYGEYQDGEAHLPSGVSIEDAKRIAESGGVGAKQDLIFKFLLEEGYSLGFDGNGNINSLRHTKDHWFDDTRFFDLFAEFVEKGSYIEMSGQDGALWRMYFDGEHCHELNAVFTYPGMDEVANDKSFVDEELLAAVENAEIGRVYDNIDDMFAYMFNEGYTFDEFVNMLTPETKEAIIFEQKWNGGVIKSNGQYYYSSEFEGNYNADTKTPSFDKYAVAKEVDKDKDVKFRVYETVTDKDVTDERDWYIDTNGYLCYRVDDMNCAIYSSEKYYYSPELDGEFRNVAKNAVVDKYKVTKEVEFESFKNALECLGYSPDDYTEEELRDMFDDHYDKLGNDDVYNAIYNETLDEVVRAHEKVGSVDKLVEDATEVCEKLNNNSETKSDVDLGKD